MLPKGLNTQTKSSSADVVRETSIVMYEHDGAPILATVLGDKKQKFALLNMRGRELELAASRLHLLPSSLPAECVGDRKAAEEYLLQAFQQADAAKAEVDLEELWAFVADDPSEYEVSEICELYYGKDVFEQHLALRLALIDGPVFFKRRKHLFQPRPVETVEELKRAEKSKEEKEALLQLALDVFEKRVKDPSLAFPEEMKPYIELLEAVAAGAGHIDNTHTKEAKRLIQASAERLDLLAGGQRELAAYRVLQKIHHFHANTNLSILKHGLHAEFGDEAFQQVETITVPASFAALPAAEQQWRLDLTHLETVTIDDAVTQDMDDAISLERTESGYQLGIHITDVASVIAPDSALDLEARHRATSIYLPELVQNMLPDNLAHEVLSLKQGEVRRAVSCLVKVDQQFEIQSYEIRPTAIQVNKRCSYDEVDSMVSEEDHFYQPLFNIAAAFEASRLANGAAKVPKKDLIVVLSDRGDLRNTDFKIVEFDEADPARNLISETMILCNKIFAEFLVRHGLPGIFRSQPGPDKSRTLKTEGIPAGPALDYAQRSGLKRSETGTSPAPHSTLGLEAYSQATSPIRRYHDLCNQRQVLHYLRTKETLYSADALQEFIEHTIGPLSRVNLLTRETRRFWLLKYLQRKRKRKEQIQGTVIRTDLKNPLVELDEIYMPTLLKTDRKVKPGDELDLRIVAVDPRYDSLKLEIV